MSKGKISNISKFILKRVLFWTFVYYAVFPLVLPTRIYAPTKRVEAPYINVQNIYFKSGKYTKINAWYIKAKKNKPTVIFCHGNGGNISFYQDIADSIAQKGYGVLLLDYRGYGNSGGFSTEKGLYKDLNAAIAYLNTKEHIKNENIILWGLSLGGAVVADVASKEQFKGVILQSTFTSVKEEAIALFGKNENNLIGKIIAEFFKNLIINPYDTKSKIAKIKSPLLIAHSTKDEMIPYTQGQKLAKLNPKAEFYLARSGTHNEMSWFEPKALSFISNLK